MGAEANSEFRIPRYSRWKDWSYARLWRLARSWGGRLYPPPNPDEIALSFDDGPNPASTARLLEILRVHDVSATFFLVGMHAEAEPELVRQMVDQGHEIGNHTWSHPNLKTVPRQRIVEELQRTSEVLERITGKPISLFRPPFGAADNRVLDTARELGMVPAFWNAMTVDWEDRPSALITNELAQQIEVNGERGRATCLVLHDRRADDPKACCDESIEAVRQLIGRFQSTHRFVKMNAWL